MTLERLLWSIEVCFAIGFALLVFFLLRALRAPREEDE